MVKHKVRGAWTLLNFLDSCGHLQGKFVKYKLKNRYSIFAPVFGSERWDRKDLLNYEHDLIGALIAEASKCIGPLTIIDCGADIGLISLKLADELSNVTDIIAFEPNENAFLVLGKNLGDVPIHSEAFNMAVSDFIGRGELHSPPYDSTDHARYIVQQSDGRISVTTVDALALKSRNLLLKIDVEGGESAVVSGATRTIAEVDKVIVAVEAHPRVMDRTGIDPVMVLRQLGAVRPFQFIVAETGENLDMTRPFFPQQPRPDGIYNIVCSSI